MQINYEIGDATYPLINSGLRVIPHVCNDEGKWGAGFSGAISKRWKSPEKSYRMAKKKQPKFGLGYVQWEFVGLERIAIVNMVAQVGVRRDLFDPAPIRYDALDSCLAALKAGLVALRNKKVYDEITVHMPRIGCGLAGGEWSEVEPLILKHLPGFPVYVYDLPVSGRNRD